MCPLQSCCGITLAYTPKQPEPDPRQHAFGYGRRACPGRYVAENALFITIAQVLSVYRISKATEKGVVVEPKVEFEPGFISRPKPYKASIVPRSDEHRALIEKTKTLYPWGESDSKMLEEVGRAAGLWKNEKGEW